MTSLTLFVRRLRRFVKTGKLIAFKEAFIAGSHLLMHTAKVIIAVILIYKFFSAIGSTYTIKPFSVPQKLAESGYTSTAVIKKIMEEREKILNYNDGSTSQSRIFFRATSKKKKVIETEIEEGKEFGALDIDAIFKTGKKILGIQEKVISGEITVLNGDELNLKIYMFDDRTSTFTGKKKRDIDSLLVEAAEYITEQTTPQYLVEYLIKKGVSKNDASSLKSTEELLNKADKLLSTLEYNHKTAASKNDLNETTIQLIACRTSWHLAKAIEFQLRKKVFKSDSLKWAKAYNDENNAAWSVADGLKSSNDLTHYVLKLSILMSLANSLTYDDSSKVKDYEDRAKALIEKYITNFEKNYGIFSASFTSEKSDYFEPLQAKGFINLSIGYLSSLYQWEKYKPEEYFSKAIKYFHNQNSILSVDNNEIAARNSFAYYFKRKAEFFQKQKIKNHITDRNTLTPTVFNLSSLIYFLKNKRQLNLEQVVDRFKKEAIKALDTALLANKSDGNIYDTFAETIFDLNRRCTDSVFYEKIIQALDNPKPVDGITVANYMLDSRWDSLRKVDKHFIAILDSFDKKNKEIYAETKKKKKDKNKNGDSLPPQHNAPQKASSKNNDGFSVSDRSK